MHLGESHLAAVRRERADLVCHVVVPEQVLGERAHVARLVLISRLGVAAVVVVREEEDGALDASDTWTALRVRVVGEARVDTGRADEARDLGAHAALRAERGVGDACAGEPAQRRRVDAEAAADARGVARRVASRTISDEDEVMHRWRKHGKHVRLGHRRRFGH